MTAKMEKEYVKKLCKHYGIPQVIELPWLKELGRGLITGEVPKISEETLEKVAEETAKAVW
ncbi:MAG: hypothetical protein DRO98_04055 [Archaeoglobales archaeon]|nr:MAG: hypothetical protein DRO98_04055 [Archaeoglobales archaeon]